MVKELLRDNFFRECQLLAGRNGLDKQIQGVAVWDAPDGIQWTQGRELVLSSGYLFTQNPVMLDDLRQLEPLKKSSGLAMKNRYIKELPDSFVAFFEDNDIPLIMVPPEPSWMSFTNQITIMVMNKNISQFSIGKINPKIYSSISYQGQKIQKILTRFEKEMGFPSMLYDVGSDQPVYSSSRFLQQAKQFLDSYKIDNFWQPAPEFSREYLCNSLNMIRYRYHYAPQAIPYSWITVPITLDEEVKAYFVVVEATGLIDYLDQFALRIGFLLLQGLYEQILAAQSIGDIGFEKWFGDLIHGNLRESENIIKHAREIGLDPKCKYYMLVLQQFQENIRLAGHANEIKNSLGAIIGSIDGRMAMLEENTCAILFPVEEKSLGQPFLERIETIAEEIHRRLKSRLGSIELHFGLADIAVAVEESKRSYQRCLQAIRIGCLLKPEHGFFRYGEFGVLSWLDIQDDELAWMLQDLGKIINDGSYRETLETLICYLENNMNYSVTAKKSYLHINTVRNRISEISELLRFDLQDPASRLNLELLLKLFMKKQFCCGGKQNAYR